jgi:hypothetical protein
MPLASGATSGAAATAPRCSVGECKPRACRDFRAVPKGGCGPKSRSGAQHARRLWSKVPLRGAARVRRARARNALGQARTHATTPDCTHRLPRPARTRPRRPASAPAYTARCTAAGADEPRPPPPLPPHPPAAASPVAQAPASREPNQDSAQPRCRQRGASAQSTSVTPACPSSVARAGAAASW